MKQPIGRERPRGLAPALVLLGWLVLLSATHVAAQQEYQLREEGWQKQRAPDPDSPAGQLQTIRKHIVQNQSERAAKLARQWIDRHPNHPRMPEARLLLGDALVARGYYYDSLYEYERVIRQYPGSDQFDTALQREYHIARQFTGGLNRLFLGMRLLPAASEGEELLIRIQERAPGSRIGEKASLALGDYYFRVGEMENAATAYDLFLVNYPQSLKRQWAMQQLIQASLARFEGPPYDPTGLIEARQRLATYINAFPAAAEQIGADSLRVRINESLALHELRTAAWFAGQARDLSAVVLYRRLIRQYPQTAAARTALDRVKQLKGPLMDEAALSLGEPDPPPSPTSDTPRPPANAAENSETTLGPNAPQTPAPAESPRPRDFPEQPRGPQQP